MLLYPLPTPSNPLAVYSPTSIATSLSRLLSSPPPPTSSTQLHEQLLTTLISLPQFPPPSLAPILTLTLTLLSLHQTSHLPFLLPPLLPHLYPLLPTILHHHLHTDTTPFLLHLLPPLLSSPYTPPPRTRLKRYLPERLTHTIAVELLVDSDPLLPTDVQVFLLLVVHVSAKRDELRARPVTPA